MSADRALVQPTVTQRLGEVGLLLGAIKDNNKHKVKDISAFRDAYPAFKILVKRCKTLLLNSKRLMTVVSGQCEAYIWLSEELADAIFDRYYKSGPDLVMQNELKMEMCELLNSGLAQYEETLLACERFAYVNERRLLAIRMSQLFNYDGLAKVDPEQAFSYQHAIQACIAKYKLNEVAERLLKRFRDDYDLRAYPNNLREYNENFKKYHQELMQKKQEADGLFQYGEHEKASSLCGALLSQIKPCLGYYVQLPVSLSDMYFSIFCKKSNQNFN